jgi:branched-chain amino acid transport system ATP-binding protein
MLEVQDIRVSYGGVLALSQVAFHVPAGKIVALVGGNGNGKSTTLRAIAGLNALDAGTIRFEGAALDRLPAHRRVRAGVVLVPEGRRLFPRLSVARNLDLGAFTRDDRDGIEASRAQVFEWFPILKERRSQLAGTLSGGEQQMLAIGRGLMARPRLLMLDEPSWGIAPKFVTQVFETIRHINAQGVSILIVEQNLRQALEFADYGYVLQTGRIVLQGSGAELLDNDDVRRAYLGL